MREQQMDDKTRLYLALAAVGAIAMALIVQVS